MKENMTLVEAIKILSETDTYVSEHKIIDDFQRKFRTNQEVITVSEVREILHMIEKYLQPHTRQMQ